DGIRDGHVTGVQTCALPISSLRRAAAAPPAWNCVDAAAAVPRLSACRPLGEAHCRTAAEAIAPSRGIGAPDLSAGLGDGPAADLSGGGRAADAGRIAARLRAAGVDARDQ